MIRIGITGGIGSGKSFVAQLMHSHFDIPVYDCDSEAKRLTNESPAIRQALTTLVGADLYKKERLDKTMLAKFLFCNEKNAKQVEAVIHPAVREDFRKWICEQTSTIVAMESAILYESGFENEVDYVLFVNAKESTRIMRAMKRDNAEQEQVEERIRRQHSEDMKLRADFLIENEQDVTSQTLINSLKEIIIQLEKI